MKKVAKCDEEELEILQAREAGALKPVADMARQTKAHRALAAASLLHRFVRVSRILCKRRLS
jgi:hypothetical protein